MHEDAVVFTVGLIAVETMEMDVPLALEGLATTVAGNASVQQLPLHACLCLALVQHQAGEDEPVGVPPLVGVAARMFSDHFSCLLQDLPGRHPVSLSR